MPRTHLAKHGATAPPRAAPSPTERAVDHQFFLFEWNEKLASTLKMDGVALQQFVRDLRSLARTVSILGLTGEAYIKTYMGKDYLILKGRAGARPAGWQGTRYLAENAKVSFMSVGVKGLANAAKDTIIVGVALYVVIDVGRAIFGDLNTVGKFLGTLGTDIAKCIVASAAGFVVGAMFVGVVSGVAAPMIIAVLVGAAVGVELERLDQEYKITQQVCDAIDQEVAEARLRLAQARRQVEAELGALERALRDFERFSWDGELQEELLRRIAPTFPEIVILSGEFQL